MSERKLNFVPVKRVQATKTGGTEGRLAAIKTKSFSMLFQRPMWRAFVYSSVRFGLPRSVALLETLTSANAKELDTISRRAVMSPEHLR